MAKKPNILFFHVDNLGMGELGCYGGGALRGADTKRMDTFAKQGAKFIPQKALDSKEANPLRSFLGQGPSAIYAYAEEDRILFGSNALNGPLGDNLKLLTGFSGILRSIGGHGGDS